MLWVVITEAQVAVMTEGTRLLLCPQASDDQF